MEYTKAEFIEELNSRINRGEFDSALNLYNQIMYIRKDGKVFRNMNVINTKLAILGIAFRVYEQERQEKDGTIFADGPSWDRIIEHYYRLKFLLRRLEFDLEAEAQEEIITYVLQNNVSFTQLFIMIKNSIIHQVKVLNNIAMLFFHNGYYDKVLPFLSEAYEKEPKNEDTNYHLVYVLYHMGELEMAQEYVSALDNRTPRIDELADRIRERLRG